MLGWIRKFILGTKAGRMTLFAGLLAVLFALVPYGCSRRPGPPAGVMKNPAGDVDPSKASHDPPAANGFQETVTLGQKYDALITRWGGDLSSTRGDLDTTRREIEALRKIMETERTAHTTEKAQFQDTLRDLKAGVRRDLDHAEAAPAPGRPAPAREPQEPPPPREGGLRVIPMGGGEQAGDPKKRQPRTAHLPCASGGQATLLNGVFAPTSGEPSPVRLRLDAALVGPNRSRVPLRGAYLIGKAQGDANASRVTIQLDRLSVVNAEGKSVDSKVLGYVVGADGLEGVPGSYEWRAIELLPYAAVASGVSGGTEALAVGETVQSITPLGGAMSAVTGNALKYAGLRSVAGGAGKLSELVVERMREIRPAVSTKSGQVVTVVFIEGVPLEGLEAQELEADEIGAYRGLDIHR
jgi:conjugal transfer pilus assembly protein TraB